MNSDRSIVNSVFGRVCNTISLDCRMDCQVRFLHCEFHNGVDRPLLNKLVIVFPNNILIYVNLKEVQVEQVKGS